MSVCLYVYPPYFPWYGTDRIENYASNNSSIVASVFITAIKFLQSRCPAAMGGFLSSRYLATIRGFLTSRCLPTKRVIHRHTHRQQRDLISILCFFRVRKVGLWDDLAFCMCIHCPLTTFECLNQYLWDSVCISWHLSPSQRRTS
jgi:hypothetical protein